MVLITELGEEKQCARCHEFWPADSEFYHKRGNGLHSYCKACITERCYELRHGALRKIKPYKRISGGYAQNLKQEDKMPEGVEKMNAPGREKYWVELDDAGKIERLRNVIKEHERAISKIADVLDRLISHEHLNGRIVHPIELANQESYGKLYYKRSRSDEWF